MSRQSTHKLYVLQRKSKTFLSCTLSGKPRPSFRVDCVREFQTFLSCTLYQGIPNLPFENIMSGNPKPSFRVHYVRESQTFLSCTLCQGIPDLPFVSTTSDIVLACVPWRRNTTQQPTKYYSVDRHKSTHTTCGQQNISRRASK